MTEFYTCKIPSYLIQGEKVTYTILIINHNSGVIKKTNKRYSELKDFHEKLVKTISSYKLNIYLPVFPGRKIFGKTYKSDSSIQQRQNELQTYMTELVQIQKLHSIEMMKEILPEPRQVSLKKEEKQQQPDSPISQKPNKLFYEAMESQINKKDKQYFNNSANTNKKNKLGKFGEDEDDEEEKKIFSAPNEGGDVYRVKIDRYSVSEDIVNYFITFYDMVQQEDWTFKTRYSEIRNLHEALKQQKLKIKIPEFPKRKIFGITNENPEDIEKRRDQLEKYLNDVFSIQNISNNEVIKFFIGDSKRQADKAKLIEKMNALRHKKKKKSRTSDSDNCVYKVGQIQSTVNSQPQQQQQQQQLIDQLSQQTQEGQLEASQNQQQQEQLPPQSEVVEVFEKNKEIEEFFKKLRQKQKKLDPVHEYNDQDDLQSDSDNEDHTVTKQKPVFQRDIWYAYSIESEGNFDNNSNNENSQMSQQNGETFEKLQQQQHQQQQQEEAANNNSSLIKSDQEEILNQAQIHYEESGCQQNSEIEQNDANGQSTAANNNNQQIIGKDLLMNQQILENIEQQQQQSEQSQLQQASVQMKNDQEEEKQSFHTLEISQKN